MTETTQIEIIALARDFTKEGKGALIVQSLARHIDNPGADLFRGASIFTGAPSIVPGGIYQATGTIEEGRVTRLAVKSMSLIRRIGHDQAVACELRDGAFAARKAREAQTRKLKGETALSAEVVALKTHYRKLHFTDREGFWLALRRELGE